jgi:hypothetical protein
MREVVNLGVDYFRHEMSDNFLERELPHFEGRQVSFFADAVIVPTKSDDEELRSI